MDHLSMHSFCVDKCECVSLLKRRKAFTRQLGFILHNIPNKLKSFIQHVCVCVCVCMHVCVLERDRESVCDGAGMKVWVKHLGIASLK